MKTTLMAKCRAIAIGIIRRRRHWRHRRGRSEALRRQLELAVDWPIRRALTPWRRLGFYLLLEFDFRPG